MSCIDDNNNDDNNNNIHLLQGAVALKNNVAFPMCLQAASPPPLEEFVWSRPFAEGHLWISFLRENPRIYIHKRNICGYPFYEKTNRITYPQIKIIIYLFFYGRGADVAKSTGKSIEQKDKTMTKPERAEAMR